MNDVAICIEGLGKRYRIGSRRDSYQTFRETLVDAVGAPLRGLRRLAGRGALDANAQEENIWALRAVSFDVNQGDVVGIIGRNGAGKSTLLKILSRITDPTEGRACVRGRVGSLLEVGTGFHGELTGRENIFLSGAILGMKRAEITRRFDEIVAFAEIDQFLDTPVKRYSSGMYVRLAFAVAAHLEPEILVVDEVLAVGDQEFQRKCLNKMGDVAHGGRTVLFVSHNMSAMALLCSRGVLLERGRVVTIGPTRDVIAEYERTTARIDGSSLADRTDRRGEGGIRLTNVSFWGSDGKPLNRAKAGEPLVIAFDYVAEKGFAGMDFGVGFRTFSGATLFVCRASNGVGPFAVKEGPGRVTCRIEALPLAEGMYSLNVSAERGQVMYDWVERACTLDVTATDFFGNGSSSPQGHSPFLVRSEWAQG